MRRSAVNQAQSQLCSCCKKPGKWRCTRCEAVYYCSKQCQRKGWYKHINLCQSIQTLADKQLRVISNACEVHSRTGKERAIAKLVGSRTEVKCSIQGVDTEALWDTGAQVSLLNRAWLKNNVKKGYEIRPVTELFDNVEVEGVGQNSIPYVGYVLLSFEMGNKSESVLTVPFLVTSVKLKQPLIGTNVIEEMVSIHGSTLLSACLKGHGTVTASAISAELMREVQPLTQVKTLRKKADLTAKAGQVTVLRCKIKTVEVDETTPVLFQPKPGWNWGQTGVRVQESVVKLKKGVNQRVRINVVNTSSQDFVFDSSEVLGTLEELDCVMPAAVQFKEHGVGDVVQVRATETGRQPTLATFAKGESRLVDSTTENPGQSCSETTADAGMKSRSHKATTFTNGESRMDATTFSEISRNDLSSDDKQFYQFVSEVEFPELSAQESEVAKTMLFEEKEAFGRHADDIGSVPELQLDLQTTDETPVQRNYNSIPKPLYSDVKKHIQTLLDKKWIQKSKSSWSSPIVIARKKDGGIRLCCDFRLLNKKTIPDKHPLPRIQESLDNLQGSTYFSTLDLSRAYYQGYMGQESRKKTAFVTPWGFYEWIRIPFGLTNAVPVFQRFMEETLEDFRDEFAIPYLDDTIVHSNNVLDHIRQIRVVLQKFQSKGLKLNLSKCQFFKREVSYLGRRVSENGYTMDHQSIDAVRDLVGRKFETVGEIRQLLGLLSYHRRHVQDFASTAKPLTDLLLNQEPIVKSTADGKTRKIVPSKNKIGWGTQHQIALEKLIHVITNPPVLVYPVYDK